MNREEQRNELLNNYPCISCIVYAMCICKYKDFASITCKYLSEWIRSFGSTDPIGWNKIQSSYPNVRIIIGPRER